LKIKRVYDGIDANDGQRILIDRLWSRGLSKEKARIVLWMRELAPSSDLRKWFSHRPERWQEFRQRYFDELKGKKDLVKQLKEVAQNNTVTLLYAAKDKERNNARVLFDFLKSKRTSA
jgi:uncharacterized protein YeaO (DUF488 family)